MAIERPPANIAPHEFFTAWLPAQVREVAAAAGAAPQAPQSQIAVALDGEGGGTWLLNLSEGELSGTAVDAMPAGIEVALYLTVADWRAAVVGEEGAPQLLPDRTDPVQMLRGLQSAGAGAASALAAIRGTLGLEISEFAGRTWALRVRFHGQAEPEAIMTIDAPTYAQMANGSLPPAQAYFAGKIAIAGDTAFAMQIGMAMMARASS